MIEIYKDFELIMIDPPYTNFKWRRRFSQAGEFQLETFFTADKFDMFAQGNVIYKRDVDEAAFVESRNIIQDVNNNLKLIVSGRFISSLLDRRVVTLEGNFEINQLISKMINENFLTAGNRKIDELKLLPFGLETDMIEADYRRESVYSALSKLLEQNQSGMKIIYNFDDRTFDLKFYKAIPTDVVLSREFANIFEQDYYDDSEDYKNVVYVGDDYVHNDDISGFERREIWVDRPLRGVEYSRQRALDALSDNKRKKTLSCVVDPTGKQFEYLKEWDVGSVVLAQNKLLNYSDDEIVTEITEFYDESGKNLEVNLGDYVERR